VNGTATRLNFIYLVSKLVIEARVNNIQIGLFPNKIEGDVNLKVALSIADLRKSMSEYNMSKYKKNGSIHLLVTEGGEDFEGTFPNLAEFQDSLLAEFFKREVFSLLLGEELERMDYLEFIARTTSHIPDKGQVMIRYSSLYANAHRGKVRKAEKGQPKLLIIEEECPRSPRCGWAAMIRKVYEVDPLTCSRCGGTMKVIALISDFSVVDRIINHLKPAFVAAKPPPPHIAYQELLMAAETGIEYFSRSPLYPGQEVWVICGSLGASNGLRDASPRSQPVLDISWVAIHNSPRWLEGEIDTKRSARPPHPKSKLLSFPVSGPGRSEHPRPRYGIFPGRAS
jgi:hypothetical protein